MSDISNKDFKINNFKKLLEDDKLSEEHKREVIKAIDAAKLVADIIDLFSAKQFFTRTGVLMNLSDPNNKNKPDA